jgi:hypothetical protein
VLERTTAIREECRSEGGTAEIPEGNKAGKRATRRVFREPAVDR